MGRPGTKAWQSGRRLAVCSLFACGQPVGPAPGTKPQPADAGAPASSMALTREELMDPVQCRDCHPEHYREWAGSMHAYASDDPVFVAMNRRAQRETKGQLGDFCVRCHAPMAVREGKTRDGLNLDDLPGSLQGVTCYFCHNAVAVGDPFNNHITLADDTTMRGGIADPVTTLAHRATHSSLHDRDSSQSSLLCGSCHDVVTPAGIHVERTLQEYDRGLFARQGVGFDTCPGCHMEGRPGPAASGAGAALPDRTLHAHTWPGVDVALSDFPDRARQRRAVECALSLGARIVSIDQDDFGTLSVRLETSAGHSQPSGAAHDRRLWLEVVAYDERQRVVFASGRIDDGAVEERPAMHPEHDRNLVLFRDWLYDAEGKPTHMLWQAASSALHPSGVASFTLPVATQLGQPHSLEARYPIPRTPVVERITVRLRMRPIGIDVLHDLVESGDLDPEVLGQVPTFTLHGASVEWSPATRTMRSLWPEDLDCASPSGDW